MALNDNLKAARNRTGLSQELVAERLGVSRQAVTKWESGQSRPSAKNLQALGELYQTPSEELLAGIQQKGPNLILRANLTRIAICAHAVFLHLCAHILYYRLRHPEPGGADLDFYLGFNRGAFIFYFGMGWMGPVLIIAVYAVYILYINPRFMNRKLTR